MRRIFVGQIFLDADEKYYHPHRGSEVTVRRETDHGRVHGTLITQPLSFSTRLNGVIHAAEGALILIACPFLSISLRYEVASFVRSVNAQGGDAMFLLEASMMQVFRNVGL